MLSAPSNAAVLDALAALLGERGLITGSDTEPYCVDWRGLFRGRALAVARPASTTEVAAVVKLCAAHGVPVVPQGGNTGMVGGGVPTETGRELILSLSRMNRIRAVDPVDMSLVAEAGVPLQTAQEAAAVVGCLLPVSIGSEGSAQIGGIISTNAGGNNTVRYGNTRDLVLGLEVVLPDGSVWNGLRRLRKDNTGYCLRQLFAGAEGTLGVITAAVMKLVARPAVLGTAFCALPSAEAALAVFDRFQRRDAAGIQVFEYMSRRSVGLVTELIEGVGRAVETDAGHYLLIELGSINRDGNPSAVLEEVLADGFEAGLVLDAAIAQNEAQRRAIWRLREEHTEAQKRAGASLKNDVSVPVSRIPEFLARATAACEAAMPGIRVAPFGHIGDGNIHFNLVQPETMAPKDFAAESDRLMEIVNDVVVDLGGSFSAEHGIGRLKTHVLVARREAVELDLMRRIKAAIDPAGILNPGRILDH
jgi:FAD/FMN-containing dehydrogenase